MWKMYCLLRVYLRSAKNKSRLARGTSLLDIRMLRIVLAPTQYMADAVLYYIYIEYPTCTWILIDYIVQREDYIIEPIFRGCIYFDNVATQRDWANVDKCGADLYRMYTELRYKFILIKSFSSNLQIRIRERCFGDTVF